VPFDEGQAWRVQRVLQLVHADVCGPMNTTLIIGVRYFLLFVDDFSRKMWVYFLKLKFDVFKEFQNFKALVENESGCHITSLRSDNRGEFCSKEFNNFCAKHGIKRQYTTPYTPQQNGVVERRDRTITEMSRCMLQNRCVPNRFWAETVFTTVYLLNRSPTMAVKQKTLEEAWFGRKPKVSHLKVFGSTAYTWIPAAKRTKLVPKSKKMMLTWYSDTHKAYRLVDVDIDKVSFSRDVVVDEKVGPFHTPPAFRVTEQPEVIEDSGVKLPIAPPEGGKDSEHDDEESEQDESPRSVRSVHSEVGSPSHGGNTDFAARDSKRPKWWHNTIGDVRIGEMIEGRSSQGKSKQQTGTVNFALMANIQEIYEP
jgi:transposase InsO family protein